MKCSSGQRILSIFLAVVMVLGCGTWAAGANVAYASEPTQTSGQASPSGTGTESDLVYMDFEDVAVGELPGGGELLLASN